MTTARLATVGLFVLGTLALFATGLFLIGERRMLFVPKIQLSTEFARVSGLQVGSQVRVSGMVAGDVREIAVPVRPAGRFRVTFTVREDLQPLVRTDSVASIQTEGLVGGTFLAITAGTETAPAAVSGTVIPSREPFQFADLLDQLAGTVRLVNETIVSLRVDVEVALRAIAETAAHADVIVQDVGEDVEAIAESGRHIVADTEAIIAELQAGRGTAGKLLKDDELYRQVTEIAKRTSAVVEQARLAVEDGRRAVAELRGKDGPAQGIARDLRQTLLHAREAFADLEENTEALKHNWFFRGFFRRRGYFDLDAISPVDYRKGILAGKDRQVLRIWVRADLLFEAGPTGELQLTADGRARVDAAMATFLSFPSDDPLVIEGYATQGSRADAFLLAQRRADVVRAYVIDRFKRDPERTGVVPLTGEAEGSPDGTHWDGVALALFVRRDAMTQPRSGGEAEQQPRAPEDERSDLSRPRPSTR
jgi:phospholipid/cholesterol/gamma-HCH transport system substrate-binding protein